MDIPPSQKEEAHWTDYFHRNFWIPDLIHSCIHSAVSISINYVPTQIGNDKLRKEKIKQGREDGKGKRGGFIIMHVVSRDDLTDWMTSEQRSEGREDADHAAIWWRHSPGSGDRKCQSPETCTTKRQAWLEKDKWEGKWEMKLGKEIIYGHCKNLIFPSSKRSYWKALRRRRA